MVLKNDGFVVHGTQHDRPDTSMVLITWQASSTSINAQNQPANSCSAKGWFAE